MSSLLHSPSSRKSSFPSLGVIPSSVKRAQEHFPMLFKAVSKRNQMTFFPTVFHPHAAKILDWIPSPAMLKTVQPQHQFDINSSHFKEIKNEQQLVAMCEHLRKVKSFSVDLEFHSQHSYWGYLPLLQVSTTTTDYVIDLLALYNQVSTHLKPIFEDSATLKLFFDSKNDVRYLQRDFDIFPVAIIDLQIVHEVITGEVQMGMSHVVNKYFKFMMDKSDQMADFSVRPLPPKLIMYARRDSHLILRLWEHQHQEMQKMDHGAIRRAVEDSKKNYNAVFRFKPKKFPRDEMTSFQVPVTRHKVFIRLHEWRDQKARAVDELPGNIVKTSALATLATEAPATKSDLSKVFPRLPRWILPHEEEILAIIEAALIEEAEEDQRIRADLGLVDMDWESESESQDEIQSLIITTKTVDPTPPPPVPSKPESPSIPSLLDIKVIPPKRIVNLPIRSKSTIEVTKSIRPYCHHCFGYDHNHHHCSNSKYQYRRQWRRDNPRLAQREQQRRLHKFYHRHHLGISSRGSLL